jgi:hypothetical protein
MKFKVNKIAAAVAVSLGTSVVGMSAAQADQILFPYLVRSDSVTTILSVINGADGPNELHYRYYNTGGADAGGACQETDYDQNSSPNDIVTFDISGTFGDDLGVLFESGDDSQINAQYRKNFALFKNIKPIRAYALVDNNVGAGFSGQSIHGEALILEFVNGASWGYRAYNAAEIYSTNGIENAFEFTDRVETAGEVLVPAPAGADNFQRYWSPIAIMPLDEITTRLFVTPISNVAPNFQRTPSSATIRLVADDPGNPDLNVVYDRDENPFSGSLPATITCVGAADVDKMISTAVKQFLGAGGWSNVAVTAGQAVVIKLEFNEESAVIDGTDVVGWVNNGVWLRKGIRESMARTATPGIASPMLPVYEIPGAQEINSPFPLIDAAKAAAAGLPVLPAQGATAADYLKVAVSTVQ